VQSWCPVLALGAQVAPLLRANLLPNSHWETHTDTDSPFLQNKKHGHARMDKLSAVIISNMIIRYCAGKKGVKMFRTWNE
jgi:hypothetical protein